MKNAPSSIAAPSKSPALEVFEHLRKATPLAVLDHGRAGNAFFMRLFDQHPQVLVIPQVGYFPFHLTKMFGARKRVSGAEVLEFVMTRTDFRYVANDLTREIACEYKRQGDDPDVAIDRPLVRAVLGELCDNADFTKKDVIAAVHAAYAIGSGRDTSNVKYLLMNDSPLHYRSHLDCSIRDAYGPNLSGFVLIHLVRDPRATFASLRQQLLKERNGMYPFSVKGLLGAAKGIFFGNAGWCVWTHILTYTSTGAQELRAWREDHPQDIYLLRNEDLNLRFTETMQRLAEFLNVERLEVWSDPSYVPTSGGRPWKGTGAYHNTYQALTEEKIRALNGSGRSPTEAGYRFGLGATLVNDPEEISRASAGPNRYVTERWKSRLTKREIAFLEAVYLESMKDLGYQPMFVHDAGLPRFMGLLRSFLPMSGELFSLAWIAREAESGLFPLVRLLSEICALPLFFLCSRLALLRLYFTWKLTPRAGFPKLASAPCSRFSDKQKQPERGVG